MRIEEGYMPFLGYQTYYRIVGEPNPDKAPLLLIHGGPGSSHNYFELMDDYAETCRQLIVVSPRYRRMNRCTSKKRGRPNSSRCVSTCT